MRIAQLGPGDDQKVLEASGLFDGPPDAEAIRRFLSERNHHLLMAYEDDAPIGFVSGLEMTHPDKGHEMFLYELSVDEGHRRQGVGTALVNTLSDLARDAGCYGMWVLTDDTNHEALRTYAAAGGRRESENVMLGWLYGGDGSAA